MICGPPASRVPPGPPQQSDRGMGTGGNAKPPSLPRPPDPKRGGEGRWPQSRRGAGGAQRASSRRERRAGGVKPAAYSAPASPSRREHPGHLPGGSSPYLRGSCLLQEVAPRVWVLWGLPAGGISYPPPGVGGRRSGGGVDSGTGGGDRDNSAGLTWRQCHIGPASFFIQHCGRGPQRFGSG